MDSDEERVDRFVHRPAVPPETGAQVRRRWARAAVARWRWLVVLVVLAVATPIYLAWFPTPREGANLQDARTCAAVRPAVGYPERGANWIRVPGMDAIVHRLGEDAQRPEVSKPLRTKVSQLVAAYDEGDVKELARQVQVVERFCRSFHL